MTPLGHNMSARRWRNGVSSGRQPHMLRCLEIRGFGLLSDVRLSLSPGLNVLSGETGAGKSMVLTALGLVSGGPVSREAPPAELVAEFDVSRVPRARLSELGLEAGVVHVRRRLLGSARSHVTVDGTAVSLARLRSIASEVLSLTSQSAVREIATRGGVLEVLDARAGVAELAARFRHCLTSLARAEEELDQLSAALPSDSIERARLVSHLAELDALDPRFGEYTKLSQRIELESRAQEYLEIAQLVTLALSEREASMEVELRGLLQRIRRAPGLPPLERLGQALGAALAALEQAGREASRLAEELGYEPQEFVKNEQRFRALLRLSERLGVTPDELSGQTAALQERLDTLELRQQRREALDRTRSSAREQAERLAAELYERRCLTLPALSLELEREVVTLALNGAKLALTLDRQAGSGRQPDAGRLAMAFSANPGEPMLPLERVASGGERARIALALCCVGAAQGRTLVFDEIDQGVGGEAVLAVAERLQRLGGTQQVLCVTHQAAIAARADAHFRVQKHSAGDRTVASVEALEHEQRTTELSRMLAGGRALAASRTLARRLLEAARRAA